MRTIMRILGFMLAVTVIGMNSAYAGQTASFSVGCTVPAIPGVNVPLVAEGDAESSAAPLEQAEETSVIVKDETRASGQTTMLVKTLYSK